MAPKKLTLAQMKQAVTASARAKKPARSRAALMKRLDNIAVKAPPSLTPHNKPTFKDGTPDVGVAGLARLVTKKETTPQLVSRLRKTSFKAPDSPKAKSCPFCSSEKVSAGIGIFYAVVSCSVCSAHGPFIHHTSMDEAKAALIRAVTLWNSVVR